MMANDEPRTVRAPDMIVRPICFLFLRDIPAVSTRLDIILTQLTRRVLIKHQAVYMSISPTSVIETQAFSSDLGNAEVSNASQDSECVERDT